MTFILFATLLILIILAFIPAIIAACKNLRFSKWYVYSFFLFPVALVHSLLIKKSKIVRKIAVCKTDAKTPAQRNVKLYKEIPANSQTRKISPSYICAVFFSKLIFAAFVGLSFFALFRVLNSDIGFLSVACTNFSITFSIMLSIVQICGFSRFPIIADEVTKRAIIFLLLSVLCSLPLYFIKKLALIPLGEYSDFLTFFFAAVSMIAFVLVLLNRQRFYYRVFSKFSDYCIVSIASYIIYAAITLILLSLDGVRHYINMIAMPMQVLSFDNLGEIAKAIPDLSYIYSSAVAHMVVAVILLLSGLLCRNFKEKELLARVEYRSTAFRMNRKRILRRHIPNMEASHIKPLR